MVFAVFPGEIAGASLKRRAPTLAAPRRGVFPGEIAGASLKPADHDSALFDPFRFSPAKSPGPH